MNATAAVWGRLSQLKSTVALNSDMRKSAKNMNLLYTAHSLMCLKVSPCGLGVIHLCQNTLNACKIESHHVFPPSLSRCSRLCHSLLHFWALACCCFACNCYEVASIASMSDHVAAKTSLSHSITHSHNPILQMLCTYAALWLVVVDLSCSTVSSLRSFTNLQQESR